MVNAKFKTEYTPHQISSNMKNWKLRSGMPRGLMPGEAPRKFTDEITAFIITNHKGTGHIEMTRLVNDRFGTAFTVGQVNGFYGRNHLNSGVTGRFEPGHEPANKGKRWNEYMSPEAQKSVQRTQFKKDHLPHNTKPIGYERVDADGYIEVKVRMRPSHSIKNDNFVLKHRLIWEQAHGPIPDDCIVIFKDGNKRNFDLDNLMLITRAQNAVMNKNHLRTDVPEYIETSLLLADIACARRKQRERRKQNGRASTAPGTESGKPSSGEEE